MTPLPLNKLQAKELSHLTFDSSMLDADVTNWLTPESLLAYIGIKLRYLDEQIHSLMTQEQGTQTQMSLISVAQSGMQGGDLKAGDQKVTAILTDLDAAIAALPSGSPVRKQLADVRDAFAANANDGGLGTQERSEFAASIGNAGRTLSESTEMGMMRLNDSMSKRLTAVQTCTGMMTKLAEICSAIAQNIGR
jgi:hypothetical protein